ncbi:MAG: iron uptake porin, partial [Microcystaceae cyanobacterium]
FQAELAALGARVDNLEGRVAFLEDHQFSTTTKLSGEAIFAVTDSFGSNDETQTIFGDRVRLELNTSFTGDDRLVTRLAAGNLQAFETENRAIDLFNPDANDGEGAFESFDFGAVNPETTQTFNLHPGDNNNVSIDWLAYYKPFKLGENFVLNTYVAAFGGIHSDYAPTNNPYFEDYDGGNGALSTFASENPIYRIGGGAGAALSFQLGFLESVLGPSTLTFGYLAGNAGDPNEGSGLLNGQYAALGQLNFNLFDVVNLGFTYVHGFHKSENAIFGLGGDLGVVGTNFANLANTQVQFGDTNTTTDFDIPDKVTNSYGATAAFNITDKISFSAFGGYTNVIALGRGSRDIWYYGGGVAFADLGKEGSVLGIFAGVQPYLGSAIGEFSNADNTFHNELPIHIEGFYKYQLTDNISITPGVIYLTNPQQDSNNKDVIIGT